MPVEKKVHRVSCYFGDSEFGALALDADEEGLEPATYLRRLWIQKRRAEAEAHALKVRRWAEECERNRTAIDGDNRMPPALRLVDDEDTGFQDTRPAEGGR